MKTTLAALAAVLVVGGNEARALTIVPTFTNSGSDTWTNTEKSVVNQAISDWQSVIGNSYTINVTFDFTHAGTSGYLGQWTNTGSHINSTGDNYTPWYSGAVQTVHINADFLTGTNYLWFDPTPATSGDQPFEAWDALSVLRHELGHMLGFTPAYTANVGLPTQQSYWSSKITTVGSDAYFEPSTLNVRLASSSDTAHVYYDYSNFSFSNPPDLMATTLYNSIRAPISATDLNMLHDAYGYTLVPEPGVVMMGATVVIPMLMRRQRRRCIRTER